MNIIWKYKALLGFSPVISLKPKSKPVKLKSNVKSSSHLQRSLGNCPVDTFHNLTATLPNFGNLTATFATFGHLTATFGHLTAIWGPSSGTLSRKANKQF